MWKPDLALACFLVATLAVWAQGPDLPPSPVQAKAHTACLECHDSVIVQQRLSRAAWTKEVDKMIRWGATVTPEDREAFIEYFTSNFAPISHLPIPSTASPPDTAHGPNASHSSAVSSSNNK